MCTIDELVNILAKNISILQQCMLKMSEDVNNQKEEIELKF